MWKCASINLKATFQRGFVRCNTFLSTKVPDDKNSEYQVKTTPIFVEHSNRYYDYYKRNCGNNWKNKKRKDGTKKSSFLGDFYNNCFDAAGWTGGLILFYYNFVQSHKKPVRQYYDNHNISFDVGFLTIKDIRYSLGFKAHNCVLPEVKAARSWDFKEPQTVPLSIKSQSGDDEYHKLEMAHQKVSGEISNLIGSNLVRSGRYKEAMIHFTHAAKKNNPSGIFNLGICHEKGLGTSQNLKMAAELYQRAADLGHATAMYNLGVYYAQGKGGLKPDIEHARELFKNAAGLGQIDAKRALKMEEYNLGQSSGMEGAIESESSKTNSNNSITKLISDHMLHKVASLELCNRCVNNGIISTISDKKILSDLSKDSGMRDLSEQDDFDILFV